MPDDEKATGYGAMQFGDVGHGVKPPMDPAGMVALCRCGHVGQPRPGTGTYQPYWFCTACQRLLRRDEVFKGIYFVKPSDADKKAWVSELAKAARESIEREAADGHR